MGKNVQILKIGSRIHIYIYFAVVTLGLLWVYNAGLDAASYIIDDQTLIGIPQLANKNPIQLLNFLFKYPEYHVDFYPLRDLSYWIDIHWFNAQAGASDSLIIFRLHNFFLFYIISILIYELTKELNFESELSFFLILIWMIHPYHAELLMWVSSRKDLLGILFSLVFLLTFLKANKKISFIMCSLSILSLIATGLSKNLLGGISCFLALCEIYTSLKMKNRNLRILWGTSIFLISVVFGSIGGYFYSHINDMRFSYEFGYRIQSSLAALGRMLLGWINPSVNAIDVVNWGDWGNRNSKYIPIALIFTGLGIGYLISEIKKKRFSTLFYMGLFLAAYTPISGLIFPHRNFYSVRYFELPALVLLFFLMERLSRLDYLNNSYSNRKKYIRISCVLILLLTGLSLFFEAKNWISPQATILKAFQLDPTNPSLKSEMQLYGMKLNSNGLKECNNKINDPSAISANGDLCWYDVISHRNIFDSDNDSRDLWLARHAEKHSVHFYVQTKNLQELGLLARGAKVAEKSIEQLEESLPIGVLNSPYHRMLYLTALCSFNNSVYENKIFNQKLSFFKNNFLINEEHLHQFALENSGISKDILESCFAMDFRNDFKNKDWNVSFNQKKDDLKDWWLKSLGIGAPGYRYGCGGSSINKYDCGSTMDQASMINLFIEIYVRTKEPTFLKEAFLFAKNGNVMCSISRQPNGPCADGKAHGTWILALLKLLLQTRDYELRGALLKLLNLLPTQTDMSDIWDYFEIYRSYLIGFIVFPEARQENFFAELERLAIQNKISTPEQIQLVSEFLNCSYKNQCPTQKLHLNFDQPQVSFGVSEIIKMNPILLNYFLKNEIHSEWFNNQQAFVVGHRTLIECGEPTVDHRVFFNFLQNYRNGKYAEEPKPYYYAEEGDNFAPVMLSTFNYLFSNSNGCAYWGIAPNQLKLIDTYYNYGEAKLFLSERRPLYLLPQIQPKQKKLRLWLVNSTKEIKKIHLNKECRLPLINSITISAQSDKELKIALPSNFLISQLIKCEYQEELNSRRHFLYP